MNTEEIIVAYLKEINPSAVGRGMDPRSVKLRRALDSMDMIGLLAHLESAFSIKISDRDVMAKNFETVGSLVDFVRAKTGRD